MSITNKMVDVKQLSLYTLCTVVLWCLSVQHVHSERDFKLSLERSSVFGPGVDPKRTSLPINYFYIQAVDTDGNNITGIPKSSFDISFNSNQKIRYRFELLDLGNGLFLCQYRVFMDILSLTINTQYKGQHIASSPYDVGIVLHENCACALKTSNEWLKDFKCPDLEPQIAHDLKAFKSVGGVNVTNLYDRAGALYRSNSFVHYSIVDGKLYAQTFGDIVGFKFLSDMILLSIVNKVQMPDMELIVNLGDWPLSKLKKRDQTSSEPFPMFSWCGSKETWDIVWPTWDFMKSTIMGMDRVTLSILTAQQSLGNYRWEDREPKAFFRGRDSNRARLDLVKDHHKNTELFDVGITAWFFFDHDEEIYGPKANRVGFHDFFKYKYQINIDGTVAAYRLPYLLAGGSLILKQDSSYYEHFYHKLEPWVHYVPIKQDISDLLEKVEWAKENDREAEEIAKNAAQFVRDNVLPEHIYCYMVRLLKEYASLQVGKPQVHPKMELVVPEVPHDCKETCQQVHSGSSRPAQKSKKLNSNQLPREEL